MNPPFGTGAHPSAPDYRDLKDYHVAKAVPPPISFTDDLSAIPVTMQNQVGICTANLCYIIERLYAKKGINVRLSRAFLYKVTKKFIEGNTIEGASLRNVLKAAAKYGVCLESTVPTLIDANTTYEQFMADSNCNWPQAVWDEALKYRIGTYLSVGIDRASLTSAMSQYGALYARFEVGASWWTPDWQRCLPLQKSNPIISGHAVVPFSYDNTDTKSHQILRNSWSTVWGNGGNGDYYLEDYTPTEAWAVTLDAIPVDNLPKKSDFTYVFNTDMAFGNTSPDVIQLQTFLKIKGYFDYPYCTGFYGGVTQDAVYSFQKDNVQLNWLERYIYCGKYCGAKTRQVINYMIQHQM